MAKYIQYNVYMDGYHVHSESIPLIKNESGNLVSEKKIIAIRRDEKYWKLDSICAAHIECEIFDA